MPATDASETSGIRNLRPRPISPEDTMYIDACRESLNQHIDIMDQTFWISAYDYPPTEKEKKTCQDFCEKDSL